MTSKLRFAPLLLSLLVAGCVATGDHDDGEGEHDSGVMEYGLTTGIPGLTRYPVMGPFNNGWEPGLGWSGPWVCDGSLGNTDYYKGGTGSHPDGHLGNDIFAAQGTPVVVARGGVVVSAGWAGIGGNAVTIRDENGWYYYYAHMDGIDGAIHEGKSVKAGERLGGVSNTGGSGTAPHLHFSIFPSAGYSAGIDPFAYLKPHLATACTDGGVSSGGTSKATHFEHGGTWVSGWGMADWAGVGDFDGDGRSDVAWFEEWNGGAVTVGLSTGKSLAHAGKWIEGLGAPDWAKVGDFDGDGLSDIAWYSKDDSAVVVYVSKGDHLADAGAWVSGWGAPDWADVGDFDGDGKSDIAWYEAWNGHSITIARSSGAVFNHAGKWVSGWGAPDAAFTGDFDGDGKSDVAWYESWNDAATTVGLSTGGGFAHQGEWLAGWGAPGAAHAGDFDGDGKGDLVWYEQWNDGAMTVARSTGEAFDHAGKWIAGWGAPGWSASGDFDGDGRSDVAWYEEWNNHSISVALAR